MANPGTRIGVLQALLAVGLVAVTGRAFQLQVMEHERWAEQAERTRTAIRVLPARRGTLYDRHGVPMAVTQENYRIGVAAWEVPDGDRQEAQAILIRDLGLSTARVRAAFNAARSGRKGAYLYDHGPFTASQIERLRGRRWVEPTVIYRRHHPAGDLAPELLGAVSDSNRGTTGLERALDSLLTGIPGEAGYLRDPAGRLYESPDRLIREPVAGHDVFLTLDADLQGIVEAELVQALESQQADAGDVLLLDPRTGEILAMASASRNPAGARRAGAWLPAEPGSTLKPFAVAGLIRLDRATPHDSVHLGDGILRLEGRSRPITDVHPRKGWITLAEAIKVSSNVATVRFTMQMSPGEHYDVLREFGFGVATGVEVPYESSGLLKRPHTWAPGNTQPSMAEGYEVEVTPLQLGAAYAALANDGVLPSLTLVREIRDPAGQVVYRHQPEPVRRVLTPEVAAEVRTILDSAAGAGGTGSRAQLANYRLIGKTGTAKNVVDGRYQDGNYTASFAAIFPARDPQLVVVVRIVNPQAGEYYGGEIAAPLTQRVLTDALAARQNALNRSKLAQRSGTTPVREPEEAPPPGAVTLVRLPLAGQHQTDPVEIEVPDVTGLVGRQAALLLHRSGLRVAVTGDPGAIVAGTSPDAGTMVTSGSAVRLRTGGPRR